MLVTNHVLSGALVGRVAPGVLSAFGLGVASHFALDVTPHWGDDRDIDEVMHIAVPDGLTGLAAIAWVWSVTEPERRLKVLAGMAGAAFPDLDKPSRVFFGASPFPAAVDRFHLRIQNESARRLPQEFLVAAAQALLIRRLSRRAG